jgi:branched-chain amino acid transport system permease protein
MQSLLSNRRAWAVTALLAIVAAWLIIAVSQTNQRQQVLTGVGTGAVIAGLGLIVVLTHRGSGVVNFAVGAMAMFFGYVYYDLRTVGQIVLPPLPNPLALVNVNIPTAIDLNGGHGVPTFVAVLITLLYAALFGLIVYGLVFRRLRHASELARAVASIGILLLLQAIVVLRFGDGSVTVPSILSPRRVKVVGVFTPLSYVEMAGIIILLGLILWVVTRFTRFGLATTASVENEKAVVLAGYSPTRLACANWIIASVLAALIGILGSPLIGLTPEALTFLIVPALASALVGGMKSFGATVAAGLGLGIVQALLLFYGLRSWFPKYGTGGTLPFPGVFEGFVLIIILIALVFRGRSLPTRGSDAQLRLPRSRTPKSAASRVLVVTAVGVAAALTLEADWRIALTNTVIGVVICLSVVVLTGFVGQASLAQLSIAGIAAFVMAEVAKNWGLGFPLSALVGILAAAVFGCLCAMPALRIRGVNLAIVTLAIAVFVEACIFKLATNGGATSGISVDAPRLFGLKFGPLDKTSYRPLLDSAAGHVPNPFFVVFCILVAAIVAWVVYAARRSPTGLRFLAVRSNERASATEGVSVVRTKLLAFAVAAVIAGVAGVLSAFRFGSVTPEYYGAIQSLLFFAFAYLGGLGGVGGALAAGFLVPGSISALVMNDYIGVSPVYIPLIGGLGLILTVVLNPDGIAGEVESQFRLVGTRWASRRRGDPTSSGKDAGQSPTGGPESDDAAAMDSPLISAQSSAGPHAQGNRT